jgi:hypothetical protein
VRGAYGLFKEMTAAVLEFFNSLFLFERCPTIGVEAIEAKSEAFAFRKDNLLFAPLISYNCSAAGLDQQAAEWGNAPISDHLPTVFKLCHATQLEPTFHVCKFTSGASRRSK